MPLIAVHSPNVHTLICARLSLKFSTDNLIGDIETEKWVLNLWTCVSQTADLLNSAVHSVEWQWFGT